MVKVEETSELVLESIKRKSNGHDPLSIRMIAQGLPLAQITVRRELPRLAALGLIVRRRPGRGHAYVYEVLS